jgi:hypothetical protein
MAHCRFFNTDKDENRRAKKLTVTLNRGPERTIQTDFPLFYWDWTSRIFAKIPLGRLRLYHVVFAGTPIRRHADTIACCGCGYAAL